MKRRYMTLERDNRHSAEVEMFDLIPESAIEEANKIVDDCLRYRTEEKPRELIVRDHSRFEIYVVTQLDVRTYNFVYDQTTGSVEYTGWEGDFK